MGFPSARRDSGLLGTITYSLHTTFLRRNPPGESIALTTLIDAPDGYGAIESKAAYLMGEHLEKSCGHELAEKALLFRNGRATIDVAEGIRSYELSSPLEWGLVEADIAARRYARSWSGNRDMNIHVNIYRDYIALRNCREGSKTFADTKRDEMVDLRCKAFNNQQYNRRIDIELITSQDTIRQVVLEDTPSDMTDTGRDRFVTLIYAKARRLFAMCVHAQLGMKCLKTLLDDGHSDETFLEEKHRCHHKCRGNFENLLHWQGSFRAAEFIGCGTHQDLQHGVVVPVYYFPKTEDEDSILQEDHSTGGSAPENPKQPLTWLEAKDKSRCGSGAFSEVFRVKIDTDHHGLEEVSDQYPPAHNR